MSRWESWAFGALHVALAVTGGAYFVMKYLLRTDDPFAVVNHPWQSSMLATHVVVAPLAMVAFGVVFRSHILHKISSRNGTSRRSGWVSLSSFTAMALSGYLLQVVADPTMLRLVMLTHVVMSAVFLVGYTTHLVTSLRPSRALHLLEAEEVAASQTTLPS